MEVAHPDKEIFIELCHHCAEGSSRTEKAKRILACLYVCSSGISRMSETDRKGGHIILVHEPNEKYTIIATAFSWPADYK